MWVETPTGLRLEQFGQLLKAVRERGGNGTHWGRPWCLPLAERVLIVVVYYRTDLTMRQLGPLFRCLVLDGVPGDPEAEPAARARAIEPFQRGQ